VANKDKVGHCGIYCGSCEIFRAWKEKDRDALSWEASESGLTVEQIKCEGCRSAVRMPWCQDCAIRSCAQKRDLESCASCPDRPCSELAQFSSTLPHHAVVLHNLRQLRDMGMEEWIKFQEEVWACPRCGYSYSFYQDCCPSCGVKLRHE